jgi:hypothetical protein
VTLRNIHAQWVRGTTSRASPNAKKRSASDFFPLSHGILKIRIQRTIEDFFQYRTLEFFRTSKYFQDHNLFLVLRITATFILDQKPHTQCSVGDNRIRDFVSRFSLSHAEAFLIFHQPAVRFSGL